MASTEQIVLLMAAHDGGAQEGSWMDMRAVPACVAGASALYLLLQALLRSGLVQHLRARRAAYSSISEGKGSAGAVNHPYEGRKWAASHVRERGGWVIFTYKCLKTGATGALSTLVAYSAFDLERRAAQRLTWPPIALTLSTLYAAVLSFITVLSPLQISRKVETHLTVVLFSIFALYTYRDIWPLMTFTLIPADLAEGKLLWAKVVLATFAGAVIPLFEPYPYIPVDPEDPMPAPNPEQTASILSFLLFAYLDPTILLAYRIPHLGHDQLPPQCDYEYTRHLIAQAYPRLDPFSGAQKTGNLFWALLVVFRHSILRKALILMLMSVLKFASPIATNRLLHYLERDGAGARVRPWVWIACMALGPMGHTLLFQLYMFYSSGTLVRAKAIITALVFDHALRIRLKAEVHGGPAPRVTSAPASELSTKRNSRAASPDSAPDGPADAGRAGARSRGSTVASRATLVAPPSSADRGRGADGAKAATAAVGAGAAKCPHLVGRINNLVTTDLENITSGRDFLLIVSAPLQAFLSMWFLYVILGWSSFVGLAVMLLLLPVPVWCAKVLQGVQEKKMNATDARVQNVTETMSVLRMIKLFGWERRVRADLADTREDELGWIWKRKMLGAANNVINYAIPLVHMVVTFGVFTVYLKKDLSASIVFSSMTGFHMLRTTVSRVVGMVPMLIQAEVSLERVSDFLHNTELLDAFTETSAESPVEDASASHADDIGFGRASFSWSSETNDGSVTPSRQAFRLRIEDEVAFKRGSFNLIIGPTGAGKTSMLMALLGEMHYIPSGPDSWVNLPRKGGIAYAAQESWVQNETIRENIIFGAPFDEERYKKVIYQCSLKRDLTLFEAGDATEVGEKGLTLSGGHKARITLARAVYSSAEILLLDSIFAALDVHTARWIVEKMLQR